MGNDPAGVVDGRVRVRGLGPLRVIDASIMPRITAANTKGRPTSSRKRAPGTCAPGIELAQPALI